MIDFACVKCGQMLSVPESLAGQTETCPACGNVCQVPSPPQWPARGDLVPVQEKRVSPLGIASLVLGVMAAGIAWIPFVNLVAIPLAVVGATLGLISLVLALRGQRTGLGMPISGLSTSLGALAIIAGVFLFFPFSGLFGLPSRISRVQQSARRDATILMLSQVDTALDRYKLDIGRYPTAEDGSLEALRRRPEFTDEALREKWDGPYMRSDPIDAWANELNYRVTDADTEKTPSVPYRLWSSGPDGRNDNGAGDDICSKAWEEEGSAESYVR